MPLHHPVWDFLLCHEAVLAANPRMGMQLKNLARLSPDQRSAIVEKAAHHRATTVFMTPAAAGEPR